MSKSNPKHNIFRSGFRGHGNFRNAHRKILSHPFKSEKKYFETRDFKEKNLFWLLETAASRRGSISLTADILRKDWDECPSSELMLQCIREIPESDIEPMCNRILLEQYHLLPAEVRTEFEKSGHFILDFHKEPYWVATRSQSLEC